MKNLNRILLLSGILVQLSVLSQSLSTGLYHSFVTCPDGTVQAFGRNDYGQLGVGNTTGQFSPVVIPTLSNITKVSAGGYFSMFLTGEGQVWMTGNNSYGNFGNNSTSSSNPAPVQCPITGITDIAAGFGHSVMLDGNGDVWACGWSNQGQVGYNSTNNSLVPVQMNISDVLSVSAGYWHSLMLKSDGTVWATGSNNLGQLGHPQSTPYSFVPVQVPGLSNIIAISAGSYYSLFLDGDGNVFVCGSNAHGQLGLGNTTTTYGVTLLPGLPFTTELEAGNEHSFFKASNGDIWACGFSNVGQNGLGVTSLVPALVSGLTDVIAIAAGGDGNSGSSLFLKSSGALWGCGAGGSGQLGIPNTPSLSAPAYLFAACGSFLPVASFEVNTTEQCIYIEPCFYVGSTSQNASSYSWSFGNSSQPVSSNDPLVDVCYSEPGTYTITLTAINDFGSSSYSREVIVHDTPEVTFELTTDLYCSDYAQPVSLAGGLPQGGFYTGPSVSNGQFDVTGAGTGEFEITYTYELPGGCLAWATDTIEVSNCLPPDAYFELSDAQVCILFPCVDIMNFSQHGNSSLWEIQGVSDGTSNDTGLSEVCFEEPGTHSVQLTLTNDFGTSVYAASVMVHSVPEVTLNLDPAVACINSAPGVELNGGLPEGGTYSGDGVSGDMFYAGDVGVGEFPVTYTVTSFGACQASATQNMTVEICESVDEIALFGMFSIRPNFGSGPFLITSEGSGNELVQVRVFSATGQLVHSGVMNGSTAPLDLQAYPSGIYRVQLFTRKGQSAVLPVMLSH
jgi:alpha-tubulin suppressor-like RCC1 family protein/PKD repeat protein